MSSPLQVLIVEDSEDDTVLLLHELRRSGYDPNFVRVETADAMHDALDQQAWDLVIADYTMPRFSGTAALSLVRQRGLDVPFILVSRVIDDETAATVLRAGAQDYLMKDNLTRLSSAIERELREAAERSWRRQVEQALWESEERFRAERRRLEEVLRQQAVERAAAGQHMDQFLGMLAHELRNQLAPLLLAAHMLRQRGGEEATRAQVYDVVDRQVQRMAHLTDGMLDVSRVACGKITLHPERLDLAQLVRGVLADQRRSLDEARLALVLDLAEEPIWVVGDPARLAQVVENLLQNGVKFTDPGGQVTVRLSISDCGPDGSTAENAETAETARANERNGRPSLQAALLSPFPAISAHSAVEPSGPKSEIRNPTSAAVLTVQDTGLGLPPDRLLRIFEAFTHVDRRLNRRRGGLGLGLGLALVKGLVELHGGKVEAASPGLGLGSTFTVWLPLERGGAALPAASALRGSATQPLRILLVDDNRETAAILSELLAMSGHEVEVVHNGAEGVTAARAFQPQVVLCDLRLPGLDGYALANALRRDPVTAAARLIAISGSGRGESEAPGAAPRGGRAPEAGFDFHLTRPVDFGELAAILASCGEMVTAQDDCGPRPEAPFRRSFRET